MYEVMLSSLATFHLTFLHMLNLRGLTMSSFLLFFTYGWPYALSPYPYGFPLAVPQHFFKVTRLYYHSYHMPQKISTKIQNKSST